MKHFTFIFFDVIFPIIIPIILGYWLGKKYKLELEALTKIQLYIFIPALLFTKIYEAELSKSVVASVILHSVLLFAGLAILSKVIARVLKYTKTEDGAFANSVCIYNSGNFSIPLIQLLYNNPVAFSIQIIIMVIQNIATNTIGIFNASYGKTGGKQAAIEIFKVPMIYSFLLALLLKNFNIPVWKPLWSSVDLLGQGLVPLALITLGVQLSNSGVRIKNLKPILATIVRLIISPVLAYVFIRLLGMSGMIGQVCVIAAAAPSAVNAILLAIQYKNEPEFSSQAVFLSTVISPVTVSIVVFLATKYI